MKISKFFAVIFALVGICAAAAAVYLGFNFKDAKPILLTPPLAAQSQAVAMMNELCEGDFDAVSGRILGNPSLGVDREAAEDVGVLIWDAYLDSLSYEMVGSCYATDSGLAQDVKLTSLNIKSVTARLQERSQAMLEQRVEEARNTSEIYDENHEYREEFVMDVLYDATVDALKEDAEEMTTELTINLAYQDGQWWIVADSALLNAISGGILY